MEHYIVAYDISNDKRRSKIFKILKDYGTHVQESVFELVVTEEDFVGLRYKLMRKINREEDSLIFYRQCRYCETKMERLGKEIQIVGVGDIVL